MAGWDGPFPGTLHQLIKVFFYNFVKTISSTGNQKPANDEHTPVQPINSPPCGFATDQKCNRCRKHYQERKPEFDQFGKILPLHLRTSETFADLYRLSSR